MLKIDRFNDKRYYISNQKLRDLGWRIQMSFDKGIDIFALLKSLNNT